MINFIFKKRQSKLTWWSKLKTTFLNTISKQLQKQILLRVVVLTKTVELKKFKPQTVLTCKLQEHLFQEQNKN